MFWQYVMMVQLKESVAISFGVLRNRQRMGNWCPLEGWGPIPTRSSAQPLPPHWRAKSMYPSHASTSSSTMSRLVLSSSVCSVYVKMASQLNHHLPLWCWYSEFVLHFLLWHGNGDRHIHSQKMFSACMVYTSSVSLCLLDHHRQAIIGLLDY